jgi:hypothetical protein
MYVCNVCGRKYRSRAWLERHMELKHGPGASALSETAEDRASLLARACRGLRIDAKDILSSRVYSDRVVIIEGPVGYKRVWHPE